jgi:hypothetical protein
LTKKVGTGNAVEAITFQLNKTEELMNGRNSIKLLLALTLLVLAGISALAVGKKDQLSAATRQELARARSATARYHDIAQAEADGYVNTGFYEPGEGFHVLKESLLDANFDPEQPETLLYAPVPGEERLQLVAVEYVVPVGLSPGAPAGFTGDADIWLEQPEAPGLWLLSAWIWEHNPTGIFTSKNPRVP